LVAYDRLGHRGDGDGDALLLSPRVRVEACDSHASLPRTPATF
jgi:hypothetical protein